MNSRPHSICPVYRKARQLNYVDKRLAYTGITSEEKDFWFWIWDYLAQYGPLTQAEMLAIVSEAETRFYS